MLSTLFGALFLYEGDSKGQAFLHTLPTASSIW